MKTVDMAKKLIEYETISPVEEPQVFEFVKEILEEEGVEAEIRHIDSTYNLVAETGSGDVSVCLNGHLDVVEPEGEWSVTEPFESKVQDGKLYGRGATDMKSEAAALISAFIALHKDDEFNGRAVLMLVGDEEIGSFNGSKPLVEEYYSKGDGFDYAIVGEPTDLDIQVGTRGVLWLNVLLEGEGVHASRAHMAEINVMDELSKALERLNNISLTYKDRGSLPSPSSEVTRVKTTETYNSVPGQVEIGLDIRYLPSQTVKGIVEELEEALDGLDCGVRVEVEQDHGGAFKLTDEKLMSVATSVMEDIRGESPRQITEGGASDGRFFAEKDTPFIELGLNQESVHGENEYCEVENIRKLRKGYYSMVKNLSR